MRKLSDADTALAVRYLEGYRKALEGHVRTPRDMDRLRRLKILIKKLRE